MLIGAAVADVVGLGLRVMRTRPAAPGVQALPSRGRCWSCGQRSYFVIGDNKALRKRMADWPYDQATLNALATRENYYCLWCGRNFRMRQLADFSRKWILGASVFEPAAFGVFSRRQRCRARRYIHSEYFEGAKPGRLVGRVRHEDITALSFSNGVFDVVITSEVFEHVDDPWRGFAEVRRVLRDGGRHFFTVPYVDGRPTSSREGMAVVYHVDPLRPQGIAVRTDFGDDLPKLLDKYHFRTVVHELPAHRPVAKVFEAVAI